MPELEMIALTPANWTGHEFYPGIAISAARAGAIGVLDLEYLEHFLEADRAASRLLQEKGAGGVGIRCGIEQLQEFAPLLDKIAQSNASTKLVILTARNSDYEIISLKTSLDKLGAQGLHVLCEAVDLAEAGLAQAAGAPAVIAKGQESAGRVGAETSFVLLQRFRQELKVPVWVCGGIGLTTSAAALAAGAAGVVLSSQLLLTRESPLTPEQKEKLSGFDGTETELICAGTQQMRVWIRPGSEPTALLETPSEPVSELEARRHLRRKLRQANQAGRSQLPAYFALGEDVAFASGLARRFGSTGAILAAVKAQASTSLTLAARQDLLCAKSPLALAHGTLYPVLQGAMTRVSDTADFAWKVAEGGAMPFLALALMRQDELEPLLSACTEKLAGLPWGAGLLGFVPPELRQEQFNLVLKYRPTCALIAGGRPDQAKELEQAGIKTYLHVPSPALLESFIEMGARSFIFEGKECGGHVGPRSSFVLWESMLETLLHKLPAKADPREFHIVFAGGIHDKISAAMVAALAAPLFERGIRVGILMGTAYLFTQEAVSAGAIVPEFQEAALKCHETVLLETGTGHAIRCLNSPYKKVFDEKRQKLESDGYSKNDLRQELELMNLGRLRVASKGLSRGESGSRTGSQLIKVPAEKQWADGMYMIGQIAVMHKKTSTIKDLHEAVSQEANNYLKSLGAENMQSKEISVKTAEEPVAIIGMSCLFPKASGLESYWRNILNKVDCIEEIPRDRWEWSKLYSSDMLQRDKIYSKWGGFLPDIPFDPSAYGIPPSSLASIDPMQLLILEVTRAALADAGYQEKQFPKDRTSIILANAGHGPITAFYSLRSMLDWTLADLDPAYRKELEKRLPEWTEDSFPGYLGNVIAGRVANRFDLGGINFCIDAACASSLAALYTGIRELRAGASDMVLLASTDTHNQPGDYLSFSKTMALSPRGRCRTFDATADGIAISEGMAVLVLKRLADAERDGDRIYALIKGIGGSSDGRDLSLTAPRPAGQMQALTRAYADAGISPSSVELIEAHGTGTVAGDKAEVEALKNVFEKSGADRQVCALGSVKTMIGHTKCSAGLASVIKVACSLYHKVLPPTMGVDTPNPACNFATSPFYLNTDTRPWLHNSEELGYPRRAGVSAFGFGGTNFHAVLEEYQGEHSPRQEGALRDFPSELFTVRAGSRAQMQRQIESLETSAKKLIEFDAQAPALIAGSEPICLFDLAYRHHIAQNAMPSGFTDKNAHQLLLSVVANSAAELLKKLEQVKQVLADENKKSLRDPRGIFFEEKDGGSPGLVAFLFPGQGSQQINMLRDLSLAFADIRKTFEHTDTVLAGKFDRKLSQYVYPAPAFSDAERQEQSSGLTNTHVAQPAVAAADMAAFALLSSFNLKADMCGGHSFGEYAALAAAQVMSPEDLFKIAEQRGAILKSANDTNSGSMTAVSANGEEVRRLIAHLSNVTLANLNSPKQCIISGESTALAQASAVLSENKVKSRPIAVSAAFHSPLMEPALKQLSQALKDVSFKPAQIQVYSNTLADPYPGDPAAIASLLCQHLIKPVEFQRQIERMYEAGARIFIECGPGAVLSGLVDDILQDKEHTALPLERSGKNGITQFLFVLAQAFVSGLDLDLGRLYKHRVETLLPRAEAAGSRKPRLTYLINASHIKRYDGKVAVPCSRPTEQAMQGAAAPSQAAAQIRPAGQGNSPTADTNKSMPETKTPVRAGLSPADPNWTNGQAGRAREQVMLEFQRSMTQMTSNFLQAQERVMLAYLQQSNLPPLQSGSNVQLAYAPAADFVKYSPAPVLEAKIDSDSGETAPLATTESAALPPAEPTGNRLDAEALINQLVQIVSDRTGYPPEMLDPSLDLEADLGIDSIKRIEILNNFRKLLPEEVQSQLENGIEKLAGSKTLQSIMDWITSDLVNGKATSASASVPSAMAPEPDDREQKAGTFIGRATVRLKQLPLLPTNQAKLSGLYIITDSENGLAEEVSGKLQAAGARTLIVRHRAHQAPKEMDLPGTGWELDLCREDLVRDFIKNVLHNYDDNCGLIHLLPLHARFETSPAAGAEISGFSLVRSLMVLARELLSPLYQKGKSIRLLSACCLGGNFAYEGNDDFNPVQAAIPGLLKTFAREYPQSFVRALDFSSKLTGSYCADAIVSELGQTDNKLIEVGYQSKTRVTPEVVPSELNLDTAADLELNSSSLILVTGGARGITAEICQELAEKHKPTFVIVGRGLRPVEPEDEEFKGLTAQKDIKAVIMDRLRRQGSALNIPAIESIYQRLVKEREIRKNLARLEATGARLHYYSLDVRDQAAFTALIDRLYDSFGKIDVVIHGAAVIEDAFIKDKSLESFDRVFLTKIEPALTLASRLQLDKLKYLIFFSSVVGRTGNAGQSDYVSANEVLNKLALKLNRKAKARVTSLLWGPWRGGMAQAELESVFAQYGWSMIEATPGRRAFYNELSHGLKKDAEVLLVGQIQNNDGSASREQSTTSESNTLRTGSDGGNGGNGSDSAGLIRARGTRLNRAEVLKQDAETLQLRLRLDPEFDLYLKDHVFDGIPVLPMAVAAELMAETAQFMYPDRRLVRLENLDIPAGIMFPDGACDLYLNLKQLSDSKNEITADLNTCTRPDATRKNFVARAVLSDKSAAVHLDDSRFPSQYKPFSFIEAEAQAPNMIDVYTKWLFHGPLFQGISSIETIGRNGIAGELHVIPQEECLKQTSSEPWIIDPILLDSAMQLAGIWARNYMNVTALPTGFKTLHLLGRPGGSKFKAVVHVPQESKNGHLCCDLAVYDETGKLILVMEKLGGVGNKSLNRLGAIPKTLRAR